MCLRRLFWRTSFKEKTKRELIHKRKMFKRNKDMIFEQDFAQPHSTNGNQEFMKEHFPAHTHALEIRRGARAVFWPEVGCFWSIERLWGIMSQRVYRNPRPTHISSVMRRLREEVRNTDSKDDNKARS